MLFPLFLAAVSWLAGFLGGLTGTGGIIMPPLMIELFGLQPHYAMALAQASYVIPSILAVILFLRKGQFNWRIAFPLAAAGFAFSFWAARDLKPLLNTGWLTLVYAVCIVISGAVMLWKSSLTLSRPLAPPWRTPILLLAGAAVGLMAGVTGSGTNSVLVPLLFFFGLDALNVLAAGQFFTVLSSSAGTFGNVANMDINFVHVGIMVATQMFGMWAGVRLAQRSDTDRLKKYVGIVCFLAGLFMVIKAVYGMAYSG